MVSGSYLLAWEVLTVKLCRECTNSRPYIRVPPYVIEGGKPERDSRPSAAKSVDPTTTSDASLLESRTEGRSFALHWKI